MPFDGFDLKEEFRGVFLHSHPYRALENSLFPYFDHLA